MADSYSLVKAGKLKLKGHKDKSHKKHKKHKRKRERDEEDAEQIENTAKHGGWWEIEEFEEMSGGIAVELGDMCYIQAMDNGLFTVGAPHPTGEGPTPEEVFTALRVDDSKVALKSGYDKYLSVDSKGRVAGRSDAIGAKEQWEPIFQEGKLALMGSNGKFVSVNSGGDVVCLSDRAGTEEHIKMRSTSVRQKKNKKEIPVEEKGNTKNVELNYVKKFQSFQDRRIRVNPEDRSAIRKAKEDGTLHEALLDRREKMKSDRYCK